MISLKYFYIKCYLLKDKPSLTLKQHTGQYTIQEQKHASVSSFFMGVLCKFAFFCYRLLPLCSTWLGYQKSYILVSDRTSSWCNLTVPIEPVRDKRHTIQDKPWLHSLLHFKFLVSQIKIHIVHSYPIKSLIPIIISLTSHNMLEGISSCLQWFFFSKNHNAYYCQCV